jgi:hypothetical protein
MTTDADGNLSSTYDIPKKVLEEERIVRGNSSARLLEVQPWFHGMVTRLRAESLVRTPGDFLVRFIAVFVYRRVRCYVYVGMGGRGGAG